MKLEQMESGLVVPVTPAPPVRYAHMRGALEITNDQLRDKAIEAMVTLWDAMALTTNSPTIDQDHRRNLWTCFGEMILGDDLPEREVHT